MLLLLAISSHDFPRTGPWTLNSLAGSEQPVEQWLVPVLCINSLLVYNHDSLSHIGSEVVNILRVLLKFKLVSVVEFNLHITKLKQVTFYSQILKSSQNKYI